MTRAYRRAAASATSGISARAAPASAVSGGSPLTGARSTTTPRRTAASMPGCRALISG
ncbi:hypothetical protein ACH35V_05400 [Actinomadura sp. 1N219]|uniref:hypothetical protein n=1 Tax=Actinomadura sp. 1N219 TaxID=3375152 RepID=UPI00379C534F